MASMDPLLCLAQCDRPEEEIKQHQQEQHYRKDATLPDLHYTASHHHTNQHYNKNTLH